MLPNKKNSTKVSVGSERKLPEAFSVLTKKPLITLAVIAAVPVVLMLAFTFKSGYTPNSKSGKFDKIVVVKTPTEIADDATAALQKKDTQTFLNILNEQTRNDPNIVNSKGDPLIVAAATMGNLEAVQQLILNGIREIVERYDVDGIHIDDYFYPSDVGDSVKELYDSYLYSGGNLSLNDWRKANVTSLVSGIYAMIKAIKPSVVM